MEFFIENTIFILLLVGVCYLLAAIISLLFPPKKINFFYGYRTNRSMKNQEQWDFAQKKSSWEMIKISVLMIISSSIPLLFQLSENQNFILGIVLIILFTILLFYRIENAIRKKFEK